MHSWKSLLSLQSKTTKQLKLSAWIHVNEGTGNLEAQGVVSSIPMPQALVDRIFESLDKGVDFMPLVGGLDSCVILS